MFRPELYRADDPAVVEARDITRDLLSSGAEELAGAGSVSRSEVGLAGWSIAHGFATLWLSGALPDLGTSVEDAARAVLARLSS